MHLTSSRLCDYTIAGTLPSNGCIAHIHEPVYLNESRKFQEHKEKEPGTETESCKPCRFI